MNQQALYDIAERELQLDRANPEVLAEAVVHAKGGQTLIHQTYWKLRSDQIRNSARLLDDPDGYVKDLLEELEGADRRIHFKRAVAAWIGAIACLLGWPLAYVFFRLAYRAKVLSDVRVFSYGSMSCFFLVVGFYGFITCRRYYWRQ